MDLHWVRRGDLAIEQTYAVDPDLVVLDVMLPGLDGFEICRELRARGGNAAILMLTARDEDFDRVLGLELGADEFIAKPVQPRVLLAHIRAILRRVGMRERGGAGGEPIVFGRLEIDTGSREVRLGGKPVDLTTSEFDVLLAPRAPCREGSVAQRHPPGAAQPRLRRLRPLGRLPHLPPAPQAGRPRRQRRAHQDHPQRGLPLQPDALVGRAR
jgi:CheY-like chemotaxis protein